MYSATRDGSHWGPRSCWIRPRTPESIAYLHRWRTSNLDQSQHVGTELGRLSERAPAEQDFERFEGELHQIMAAAARSAHELSLMWTGRR